MRAPAGFQGFRAPPAKSVNADRWADRVEALTNHLDQWAEYGPYTSSKSAHRANDTVRAAAEKLEGNLVLDSRVDTEDEGETWALWVRVRDVGVRSNVRELNRRTG